MTRHGVELPTSRCHESEADAMGLQIAAKVSGRVVYWARLFTTSVCPPELSPNIYNLRELPF